MSAVKSLQFSTETSHVYSDPAACTSYTTRPPLAQSTPVPSSRQAFLLTRISPIQTKNDAHSQGDVHGDLRSNVAKDFHLSKPGCSDSTIVKLQVHSFLSPEDAIHLASAMDRDLRPAPIFSPRFTDFRSFCAVSCFYQNGRSGNKLWTRKSKYEVLKLLVVREKDVLAVLPTGYGKSLIY